MLAAQSTVARLSAALGVELSVDIHRGETRLRFSRPCGGV